MKLSLLSLFFVISIVTANIIIDVEDGQLQSIAEILVQNYIENNIPQTGYNNNKNVKKFVFASIQLVGITISLVTANLITALFEPSAGVVHLNPISENTTLKPSPICDADFGCDRGACWRTCGNSSNSACFTTSTPTLREFHTCKKSVECSPCWSCVGPCITSKQWRLVFSHEKKLFIIPFFHPPYPRMWINIVGYFLFPLQHFYTRHNAAETAWLFNTFLPSGSKHWQCLITYTKMTKTLTTAISFHHIIVQLITYTKPIKTLASVISFHQIIVASNKTYTKSTKMKKVFRFK